MAYDKVKLQPFSYDFNLAFNIIYTEECVNFIHEFRYLQFKIAFERQVFEKLFTATSSNLRSFPEIWQEASKLLDLKL